VNSIFFRIYGGMLLVLVTVSLLGLLIVQMVNGARVEDYRERIASGTFRLMADNLQPMDQSERLRTLAAWTRLIGVPLELAQLDDLDLESNYWARLIQGRVLVRPQAPPQVRVYALVDLSESVVLTADIQRISEQLGRATLYLITDELVRYPERAMPERLQQLRREKGFGYPLHLTPIDSGELDLDQRRRLEESDTVMALGPEGDSVLLYVKIPNTNWVLGLGPLYRMDPYPTELLVITGSLLLTLGGLLIYLLVRQLEQRLRTLEAAASHITRGNLDTRVSTAGQDSVGRLSRAFNDMASHLQRLMRLQREMIGAVSHELRTPVARLRFGLEMVETAATDQDRKRYLEGMDGDLSELDMLVDEILTYARLEQGAPALTLVPTDIPSLVDQVITELAPLSRSIAVEHADQTQGRGTQVDAEPRYLQRAIANLVSNAMRHASERVLVTTRVEHGRCRVTVEDDGPGIPEAFRERVFTPFLRLDDSRTRASGGYGLGLSIVRRVIFWHQGRARAEQSRMLGGAAFILDWPARQA